MPSYRQLIQRLFNVNLFGGVKLGLENCHQLQALLQHPDREFRSIHVAGTNGKGSVATKVAASLQQAGYRVGLYTSPHLSCFRERIRINGQMISEAAIEDILPLLFDLSSRNAIPATFFELTTFLAFVYFAQEKVDVAVLETGLGGRLDATNVVNPILSVITSISLDHTDILGMTEESIAKEKAGIIKPGVPVVIGPQTPQKLLQNIARQRSSPCLPVKERSPLFGKENEHVARASLGYLKSLFNLSNEAIEKGLEANPPCRFETMQLSAPIILDVAHNPDGLQHLFQAIRNRYPIHPLRVLFGLSKSKDIKECLRILAANGTHFHLVEAANGRGAALSTLNQLMIDAHADPARLSVHSLISEGVQKALKQAADNQQILVICGSFFIMSEVRKALGVSEPRDEIDLNERHAPIRLSA